MEATVEEAGSSNGSAITCSTNGCMEAVEQLVLPILLPLPGLSNSVALASNSLRLRVAHSVPQSLNPAPPRRSCTGQGKPQGTGEFRLLVYASSVIQREEKQ